MESDTKEILYSIFLFIGAVLLVSPFFYLLWNDVMPTLFQLPRITFIQGVEMLLLISIPRIIK